jgi:L-fuconolactonase
MLGDLYELSSSITMRIDSHQHFWRYSPAEHVWMTDAMGELKRDFLPEDLQPLLAGLGFDGCVAVQARQSLEETRWLLELAESHGFVRGVVGWVDLRSPELLAQLERFAAHPRLVGVRHVVQDEPDDDFMLRPEFRRGIAQLRQFGLTYDLLIFPRHLPNAARLVEEFPDQPFVLDHIAKPAIAGAAISPWCDDLRRLAHFPNVYCKLSGMVTEAKWHAWQPDDLRPYLDVVVDAFGTGRLMIGSDWPVCTLSASYASTMQLVMEHLQQLSAAEQSEIFGETCARFYGIDRAEV